MKQLGERFIASELTDKLLSTETEIEKGSISNIEIFKKVVTGDEISVEEKYKNRYTIKPFCKFIWGTNNLPELNQIADEGFYRRINIIPFEKQFTTEESISFNKNKILTPEAIDYLANISLRAYLKIINTRVLANHTENNTLINSYRQSNNSVETYLSDEITINELFANDNKALKTQMYFHYSNWCQKHKFFIKKKKEFYEGVLSRTEYMEYTIERSRLF